MDYFTIDNNHAYDTLSSIVINVLVLHYERKNMQHIFKALVLSYALFSTEAYAGKAEAKFIQLEINTKNLHFLKCRAYFEALQNYIYYNLSHDISEFKLLNESTSATFNSALVKNDYAAIVKFLYYKPKVDIQNIYKQTALHYAVTLTLENTITQKIAFYIVKLLLLYGFNPNIQDSEGNTPLHRAIDHFYMEGNNESLEIIKALLNHNANPNIRNKTDKTALDIALKIPRTYEREDIAAKLIHLLIFKSDRADWPEYYKKTEKMFRHLLSSAYMQEPRIKNFEALNTCLKNAAITRNQKHMYLYENVLHIFDTLLQ